MVLDIENLLQIFRTFVWKSTFRQNSEVIHGYTQLSAAIEVRRMGGEVVEEETGECKGRSDNVIHQVFGTLPSLQRWKTLGLTWLFKWRVSNDFSPPNNWDCSFPSGHQVKQRWCWQDNPELLLRGLEKVANLTWRLRLFTSSLSRCASVKDILLSKAMGDRSEKNSGLVIQGNWTAARPGTGIPGIRALS